MKFRKITVTNARGVAFALSNYCRDVEDVYDAIYNSNNAEQLVTYLDEAFTYFTFILLSSETDDYYKFTCYDSLGNKKYVKIYKLENTVTINTINKLTPQQINMLSVLVNYEWDTLEAIYHDLYN